MCSIERKLLKLIENSDQEWKISIWKKLVRERLGCEYCQHCNIKKGLCKNVHQDVLEEHQGIPCEDILPTKLKK